MPVERLRPEASEQRRRRDRVAAEAEEVLEAQAPALVGGKETRRADGGDLVAQGPHGVETHRLVAGGVRDDVGIGTVRVADIVLEGIVDDPLDEATRRDGAAGMPGRGNVVVEEGAQGTVHEIEGLEVGELAGGQRPFTGPERLADVHAGRAPGAERNSHDLAPFADGSRVSIPPRTPWWWRHGRRLQLSHARDGASPNRSPAAHLRTQRETVPPGRRGTLPLGTCVRAVVNERQAAAPRDEAVHRAHDAPAAPGSLTTRARQSPAPPSCIRRRTWPDHAGATVIT